MADKSDYYQVLGVDRDADADAIKRAYRRGALKFHPDNYKGDKAEGEAKFRELAEAYEALSDPVKRRRYDQYGHEGLAGSGMHDFSGMGFGDIGSMFEDILGSMGFGGARANSRAADRGYDLETQVEVTLKQVSTGVDQSLEFQRMDLCEACGGSGSKRGVEPQKCVACGGYGQVQQQIPGFFGVSVRITACPRCKGKGVLITNPCPKCRGTGRTKHKRILTVKIPAGIRDGEVMRLRGEGEPGLTGTSRGDLHCYVRVKQHPMLARRGDDLICQVPIPFSAAALGGSVKVPTLTGPEEIEIPAGTQNGDVIDMPSRGLPSRRTGKCGNQHVQVFVAVPRKLTARQRELLEEFAETEQTHVSPERKSFFQKLKDCFG